MMTAPQDQMATARKTRNVGLVMAGTMLLWIGAQFVGGEMEWPLRFALLVDLMALAAFVWALVATYRIWRKRRA